MAARKILLYYGVGFTEKLKIELPPTCESDVSYTKRIFLSSLKSSGQILNLGGDSDTSLENVELFRYDADFEEEFVFSADTKFVHGQKDICGKISKVSETMPATDYDNDLAGLPSHSFIQAMMQCGESNMTTPSRSRNECTFESIPGHLTDISEPAGSSKQSTNVLELDTALENQSANKLSEDILSLPELTNVMFKARADGKLDHHLVEFVQLHAYHLLNIMAPKIPSTQDSKDYIVRFILETYPEFIPLKDLLKSRFFKCLRNKKDYLKNGSKRREEKRLADEVTDSLSCSSSSATTSDASTLPPDFLKRRSIIADNEKASFSRLLELIPEYRNLDIVQHDFGLMEPIKLSTKVEIEQEFGKLMTKFRKYLIFDSNSKKGKKVKTTQDAPIDFDQCDDIDVILAINKLCSTLKGVPDVPLIKLAKVGTNIVKNPRHKVPVAVVFYTEDIETRRSKGKISFTHLLIHLGNDLSFIKNETPTSFQIVMYLLAIYYCFDLQFPAMYGILRVFDKFCLSFKNLQPSNSRKKTKVAKSKNDRKEAFIDFMSTFETFESDI